MGAIRLLQQHRIKPEVREEDVQTDRSLTPPVPARRPSTSISNSNRESTPRRPDNKLEINMEVIAVWLDHDALGYEVKCHGS